MLIDFLGKTISLFRFFGRCWPSTFVGKLSWCCFISKRSVIDLPVRASIVGIGTRYFSVSNFTFSRVPVAKVAKQVRLEHERYQDKKGSGGLGKALKSKR